MIAIAKLESIKGFRQVLEEKIEKNVLREDRFVANSLKKKGLQQASYEQVLIYFSIKLIKLRERNLEMILLTKINAFIHTFAC